METLGSAIRRLAVPVLAELNRRKAVVHTPGPDRLGVLPESRSISARAESNARIPDVHDAHDREPDRQRDGDRHLCPDVRFIFSHAGGTLVGVAGWLLGAEMTADNLAKPAATLNFAAASSAPLLLRHGRIGQSGQHAGAEDARRWALRRSCSARMRFSFLLGRWRATSRSVKSQRWLLRDELRGIERDNALNLIPRSFFWSRAKPVNFPTSNFQPKSVLDPLKPR